MRKDLIINNVNYNAVPMVTIPKQGGGSADFYDTTDADASQGEVLSGKKYYNSGLKTGSMVENGTVTGTISTKDGTYTIGRGHHSGSGSVSIRQAERNKIVSGNIRSGVSILGVSGSSSVVDTASGDAVAGDIISGKKRYVNGSLITGSLTAVSVSQDSTTKVLTIQ